MRLTEEEKDALYPLGENEYRGAIVMTPNDDGTFSATQHVMRREPEGVVRVKEIVEERKTYRSAVATDEDLHKQGKLAGKTITVYDPSDFVPRLLVEA